MRCLVTGGAGFLGSHMAERLRKEGHEVATADLDPRLGMHWDVRRRFPFSRRNDQSLPHFDWVFHFAGLAAIPPSLDKPVEYMAVNAQGTVNALEAAQRLGATRFLYAASGTCYGFNPPQPTPETAPIECETPYAFSKWCGEEAVRHWDRVFNLPSVSLRLFSPYGPRMGLTSAMGHFLKLRKEGKPVTITGDGEQYRDMHYVDDCIEAFYLAAQSGIRDTAINIGSGTRITINELVSRLGFEQRLHVPARLEAPGTHADISLAKRLLGWEPSVSFEEGIRRTLSV